MSNLQQRIITAVVLLALFIPALYVFTSTPGPFFLLTLLLIAAAGWEWSRLVGWPGWRAWASGAFCAVCSIAQSALLAYLFDLASHDLTLSYWPLVTLITVWSLTCLLWVMGGAWLLWRGVERWPVLPRWLRWGMGMVMLVVAMDALGRAIAYGMNFLLSILVLVWAADIGGYVFGRAFGGKLTGGRKLAPSISPGKTWEGAVGGFISVLVVGAVWIGFDSSSHTLYSTLWKRGPIWFLLGLAFLTAMSIVGDLIESLVKRAAGVKDSSGLLPGHGGVLDRIDGLLPTLPLALLITQFPLYLKLLPGHTP